MENLSDNKCFYRKHSYKKRIDTFRIENLQELFARNITYWIIYFDLENLLYYTFLYRKLILVKKNIKLKNWI